MERTIPNPIFAFILASLLLLAGALVVPLDAQAQDRPPERQIRSFIPPDQLVSFLPETPFDQFLEFLNPIFERVTGKQVIDPMERTEPIGISITGVHFFDALELVLQYNELAYRETDRFFIIEAAPEQTLVLDAAQATGRALAAETGAEALPATLASREIRINAILFDVNVSKQRELGIDWNVLFGGGGGFGSGGSSGGSGGSGGGTGGGANGASSVPRVIVDLDGVADAVPGVDIEPSQIEMTTLTQLFRAFENEGIGETVANPTVTVQSGEEGRIQIGSDVPVNVRDFAGNTVTQFFSTGIIVKVTPTLIEEAVADTSGAPTLEFVHLDVEVENSTARPSQGTAPIIDRNTATTQVVLLNGEQTLIGGLYSTVETENRRGIPLLKDLPPWFFGLRYVFGFNQKALLRRELLVVVQANVVDPIQARAQRPFEEELIEKRRRQIEESLRRIDPRLPKRAEYPQSTATEKRNY